VKHKYKKEIRESSAPFDIKRKCTFNKISQEMGFICPEYNTIKSQISRNINKQLPHYVKTFDETPHESECYKTKRDKSFAIFKNSGIIIF